jgi:hypothetical protein
MHASLPGLALAFVVLAAIATPVAAQTDGTCVPSRTPGVTGAPHQA